MDSRLQLLGKSLDALPVNVSLLDPNGTIIQTNEAWREFGARNGVRMDADTVGTNYLAVCERSSTETATQTRRGPAALLAGVGDEFEGMLGETIIRQAIWTHEVQTTATTEEDPAFDWRDESERAYTERAVAAVPITHGGTLYSICCVYTDRSTAFGSDERAILSQLGAVVGHAIAASERTQALMSDELIEVDLQIPALFSQPTPPPADWAVDITQTVAVSDEEYIMYGTTTDAEIDAVRSVFEPLGEIDLSVIGGDPENLRIELRQFQQCVIPLLAAHGWSTEHAVLTNGDCYLFSRKESRRLRWA